MHLQFEISLDFQEFKTKPNSKVAVISQRIANQVTKINIKELAEAINQGRTYCNAVFKKLPVQHKRCRKAEYFESQQVFSVDLDNGKFKKLEEILDTCEDVGLEPGIVYHSFSSTPEKPKWRLIFFTDKPVYNGNEAKAIIRYCSQPFDGDPAVVDSARLLYGTYKGGVVYVKPDAFIDLEGFKAVLPKKVANPSYSQDLLTCSELDWNQQETLLTQLTKRQLELVDKIVKEAKFAVKNPAESFYGCRYKALFSAAVKLAKISYLADSTILYFINLWMQDAGVYNYWKYSPERVISSGMSFGRQHMLF